MLQMQLQVWEEKAPLLYWTADLHCWVFLSLYLLKEIKYICCCFMPHTQKAYSNSPVRLINITQRGTNLSNFIKESSILEIVLKVLPRNVCNSTKVVIFLFLKLPVNTSEFPKFMLAVAAVVLQA